MTDTAENIARDDTPQPGSRQEAEALARLDIARSEDVSTYEGRRRTGWDARAGQPIARLVPEDVFGA